MNELLGFNQIHQSLKNSFLQNKLHHSLLISGSKSIGKANFAKNFASEILSAQSGNNHENQGHPDLLLIERAPENKNINVEQIRQIANFVTKTPAIADVKFVIIDAVDDLNQSSANALLKILEEPLANNFLILISHNIGKTLPTIRSRCFLVDVKDLSFADFKKIVTKNNQNFSENELQFLGVLTNNSPALALNLKEQNQLEINQVYEKFLNSISKKQIDDFFLKLPASKDFSQESFVETFNKITDFFLQRLVFFSFGTQAQNLYFQGENEVFSLILQQKNQGKILDLSSEINDLINKGKSLNLDLKQTISNIFNMIFYG